MSPSDSHYGPDGPGFEDMGERTSHPVGAPTYTYAADETDDRHVAPPANTTHHGWWRRKWGGRPVWVARRNKQSGAAWAILVTILVIVLVFAGCQSGFFQIPPTAAPSSDTSKSASTAPPTSGASGSDGQKPGSDNKQLADTQKQLAETQKQLAETQKQADSLKVQLASEQKAAADARRTADQATYRALAAQQGQAEGRDYTFTIDRAKAGQVNSGVGVFGTPAFNEQELVDRLGNGSPQSEQALKSMQDEQLAKNGLTVTRADLLDPLNYQCSQLLQANASPHMAYFNNGNVGWGDSLVDPAGSVECLYTGPGVAAKVASGQQVVALGNRGNCINPNEMPVTTSRPVSLPQPTVTTTPVQYTPPVQTPPKQSPPPTVPPTHQPKTIEVCRPGTGNITINESDKLPTDLPKGSAACQPVVVHPIEVCRPGVGNITILPSQKLPTDKPKGDSACQPPVVQPIQVCRPGVGVITIPPSEKRPTDIMPASDCKNPANDRIKDIGLYPAPTPQDPADTAKPVEHNPAPVPSVNPPNSEAPGRTAPGATVPSNPAPTPAPIVQAPAPSHPGTGSTNPDAPVATTAAMTTTHVATAVSTQTAAKATTTATAPVAAQATAVKAPTNTAAISGSAEKAAPTAVGAAAP